LPVNQPFPPNPWCVLFARSVFSLWGPEIGPQEASMKAKQASPRSLKSIAGAILLALGFLVLFANLDAVAAQISGAVGIPGAHEPDVLPAVVLGALHAVQSYVFDHSGFLSALLQILVSFWPLTLIVLGGVLLRDAFRGLFANYKAGAGVSAMGDR
jgi:hypothetical protein